MKEEFEFSVIMPIYNTDVYLEEAIASVIEQTIGFRENIQLILVDNASEDDSSTICKKYQDLYPENILFIALKENRGPSRARNIGAKYIRGHYVNFMDSDDKWETDAFSQVKSFFDEHQYEVDAIACRIKQFDARNGYHAADFKFCLTDSPNRIISIFSDFECVQLHVNSTFIKAEYVQKHQFDETMRHAEDSKYITELILDKNQYGLMGSVTYLYRKRKVDHSLLAEVKSSHSFYFEEFELPQQAYFRLSCERFGYIIPYVQFLVMYSIQFRLIEPIPADFTAKETERYVQSICRLLENIDDYIIFAQRNLSIQYKLFAFRLKHPDGENCFYFSRNRLCWNGVTLLNCTDRHNLHLQQLETKNGVCRIQGRISLPQIGIKYQIVAVDDKQRQYVGELFALDSRYRKQVLGRTIDNAQGIVFHIPIQDIKTLSFCVLWEGTFHNLGFYCDRFFPLNREIPGFFCEQDGIVYQIFENSLQLSKKEAVHTWALALRLWKNLLLAGKKTAFLLHIFSAVQRAFCKKKIWLISDRLMYAGDNGEALLHYLLQEKPANTKLYYVLSPKSPDWERMRAIVKTVNPHSMKYRLLFLRASWLAAGYMDDGILYPFGVHHDYIKDILHIRYLYLQHGVIKDDFSQDQNKERKNISLFVTSSPMEQKSLTMGPYGYISDEVILTGLPRFDALTQCDPEKEEKLIVFAPTWRAKMRGTVWNNNTGLSDWNPFFRQSDYYKFYNKLINDPRLLECMRKYGYSGRLRLHPVIRQYEREFEYNDCIAPDGAEFGYKEEIERAALLITDYSSIAFDYSFAKKPCIYIQFDLDNFFQMQWYDPGYFDYERDGFGPVCYDYDTAVSVIISTIENGCIMEEKYQARVKSFFPFRDGKNCERIYNEILKLDE